MIIRKQYVCLILISMISYAWGTVCGSTDLNLTRTLQSNEQTPNPDDGSTSITAQDIPNLIPANADQETVDCYNETFADLVAIMHSSDTNPVVLTSVDRFFSVLFMHMYLPSYIEDKNSAAVRDMYTVQFYNKLCNAARPLFRGQPDCNTDITHIWRILQETQPHTTTENLNTLRTRLVQETSAKKYLPLIYQHPQNVDDVASYLRRHNGNLKSLYPRFHPLSVIKNALEACHLDISFSASDKHKGTIILASEQSRQPLQSRDQDFASQVAHLFTKCNTININVELSPDCANEITAALPQLVSMLCTDKTMVHVNVSKDKSYRSKDLNDFIADLKTKVGSNDRCIIKKTRWQTTALPSSSNSVLPMPHPDASAHERLLSSKYQVSGCDYYYQDSPTNSASITTDSASITTSSTPTAANSSIDSDPEYKPSTPLSATLIKIGLKLVLPLGILVSGWLLMTHHPNFFLIGLGALIIIPTLLQVAMFRLKRYKPAFRWVNIVLLFTLLVFFTGQLVLHLGPFTANLTQPRPNIILLLCNWVLECVVLIPTLFLLFRSLSSSKSKRQSQLQATAIITLYVGAIFLMLTTVSFVAFWSHTDKLHSIIRTNLIALAPTILLAAVALEARLNPRQNVISTTSQPFQWLPILRVISTCIILVGFMTIVLLVIIRPALFELYIRDILNTIKG
ncbi:hypothetical protein NEHOM01_2199 [Nematocida homosporus]|uniref:uncharacterized protein n=1 Tax=Nematocida homosporus TaxID=1912981 RepID=UPI00221FFF88|nr:uncharacterized protein NEHOM01_2199 [Nematocida homosporus]KAI5187466.1 hypothetical protein NEHOM01_2199 [Nematocida homosporus]